ncbi:MAG: histidine phosphatase family protein [Pseudomonadales bacterium]
MSTIYMVRHGQASASFTDDLDPGLDELGRSQASKAAQQLINNLPLVVLSSPLKRAQETAEALSSLCNLPISIENRVAEVPSPGLSLDERGPWLSAVMQGRWPDQSDDLKSWQQNMVSCLLDLEEDTVIFTHFVAINAIVTAAEGLDNVLAFRPGNCSITILENTDNRLKIIKRGDEASTKVN